jgi:hypothetical protein
VRQLTGVQRRAVMGLLVLAGLLLVVDFTPKRVHTPCGGVATSNGIPYWSPSEICGAQRSGAVLACGIVLSLACGTWFLGAWARPMLAAAAASFGVLASYSQRRLAANPISAEGNVLGPFWEGARNLYGVAAVSITGLVVYLWFRARRPIEEDEAT